MSEGEYEYECMRCDLLGQPRPDRETFQSRPVEKPLQQEDEDDVAVPDVNLPADQDIDIKDEHIKNASGGLDELNNILSLTQKKLNKFKVVCGSFTNLLRMKVGGKAEDGSSETNSVCSETENSTDPTAVSSSAGGTGVSAHHEADVSAAVDSQVDKLDSLLMKAEKAHISMTSQNKQMKSFLK